MFNIPSKDFCNIAQGIDNWYFTAKYILNFLNLINIYVDLLKVFLHKKIFLNILIAFI